MIKLLKKNTAKKLVLLYLIISVVSMLSIVIKSYLDNRPPTIKEIQALLVSAEADIVCKKSLGSGFFIDSKTVVTNAHVVRGCGKDIDTGVINVLNGSTKFIVKAIDKENDLALLTITSDPTTLKIQPLKIAKQDIELADQVFSSGNKGGIARSFHLGYVQSMVDYGSKNFVGSNMMNSFGGSGSAVVNDKGEIVGVIQGMFPTFYVTLQIPLDRLKDFLYKYNK